MLPIMTLPTPVNKSLIEASNLGGFHEPDHTTSADYARSIRHCRRELGGHGGYRLLADGGRSFHRFLHCFSGINDDRSGSYSDAEGALQGAEIVGEINLCKY